MSAELVIGNSLKLDDGVTLGYRPSRSAATVLTLGAGAPLRSGTVTYARSKIGSHFETGHHVVVREGTSIGNAVSVWSNTVVDYGCVIGNRVKIHCNCYLAQFTEPEDDVFLAPGVTVANDLFPGQAASASAMAGPLIQAGAQIGVNATILPYVTIGAGAIIGAGSVVTRDVAPGVVAHGNPAVPGRHVEELEGLEARLRAAHKARMEASTVDLHGRPPITGREEARWHNDSPTTASGQRIGSVLESPIP
jgi:acetyltransferase-like isoleucine patch superfamily enzyme